MPSRVADREILSLARLEAKSGAEILEQAHPTLAADILFRMSRGVRDRFLDELPAMRAADLRRMTDYGPRRAGGRPTTTPAH
jgi:Mg/Co/Ni transporter MgtE